jgi:hypothetical protein
LRVTGSRVPGRNTYEDEEEEEGGEDMLVGEAGEDRVSVIKRSHVSIFYWSGARDMSVRQTYLSKDEYD